MPSFSYAASLRLAPTEIRVKPEDPPAQLMATISNTGQTVERYRLEVEGIDPTWYTVERPVFNLLPGDSLQVNIRVHPRLFRSTYVAEERTFQVKLRLDSGGYAGEYEVRLEILGQADIRAGMEPTRVTGRRGRYAIRLTNNGAKDGVVTLDPRDPENGLNFDFKDMSPTVPAHGTAHVDFTVKPYKSRFVGFDKMYPFTVQVIPEGREPGAPELQLNTLRGELMYTTYLKSWRLPIMLLLLATLIILAIIFVPVILLNIERDKQANATATAVAQGATATAAAVATEVVKGAPVIVFYSASSISIKEGEGVTLLWEVKNVDQVEIREIQKVVKVGADGKGSLTLRPTNSVMYTLCVSNELADTPKCQPLTITVLPAGQTDAKTTQTPIGQIRGTPTVRRASRTAITIPTPRVAAATATPVRLVATPRPGQPTATRPPVAPVTPVLGCDTTGNQNGSAQPSLARVNDLVQLSATGFQLGEPIFLSFLTPQGDVRAAEKPIEGAVNPDGSIALDPITITEDVAQTPGRWRVTILGAKSAAQSVIFFCIAAP